MGWAHSIWNDGHTFWNGCHPKRYGVSGIDPDVYSIWNGAIPKGMEAIPVGMALIPEDMGTSPESMEGLVCAWNPGGGAVKETS